MREPAVSASAPPIEPDIALEAGDVIMAMGTPRTMDRLETLFAPRTQSGTHAGAQL
jgi:hypothetical protein